MWWLKGIKNWSGIIRYDELYKIAQDRQRWTSRVINLIGDETIDRKNDLYKNSCSFSYEGFV